MKRHMTQLVALALVSTLAASTAFAGHGNSGLSIKNVISKSQSSNNVFKVNKVENVKKVENVNKIQNVLLNKTNVLKVDNLKIKNNNGPKILDLGSKHLEHKLLKDMKANFCEVKKDKCHNWYKYHCWFPCWGYAGYETCTEIVRPIPVSTPVDLQLVDVRFGDVGDPASGLGPRFRITVYNASPSPVSEFKVVAVAVANGQPSPNAPPVVAVIDSMEAGEVKSFDVRLPVEALTLSVDPMGNVAPFSQLGVVVDADNQIPESNEENNQLILDRQQIQPISF